MKILHTRSPKDIPIESNDEDIPLFEEEDQHDKAPTNQEEEGPSEPIQYTIFLKYKKGQIC